MSTLSVVIPAWNEEDRVGGTIARICEFLDERGERYELIVVDDGSTDRTREVVEELMRAHPSLRLLSLPKNRGKGAAVRAGVLATAGDEVLFSDADLATPIEEIDRLRDAMRASGAEIAIGSRATGERVAERQPAWRERMGRTFNLLVQALVLRGIGDTQCGFKLFRGDVARELFARSRVDGFAFDVEILLLARPRYKVAEVPVVWRHVEQSKVSPGRDAARMLWDILKMRWRKR